MKTLGIFVAALAATLAAGAAWGASPPPTGTAAFQACLKAHGVTLGKTTDQKKISAALVACRSSAPSGGLAGGQRRPLTPAQQAAFKKYTMCLAKHGVKISFRFGQRPSGQSATGQRPTGQGARQVPAKVRAAQKACASLRPKFAGPRPPAGAGA